MGPLSSSKNGAICAFASMVLALLLCFAAPQVAYASIAEGTTGPAGDDASVTWVLDDDGVLTVSPTNGELGTLGTARPWASYATDIKEIVFEGTVIAPTSMSSYFSNFTEVTKIDFGGLDTSGVTDMRSMFYYCRYLTDVNVNVLDTSSVTTMYGMFDRCYRLINLDLSGLDTSNVTSMASMFNKCQRMQTVNLSGLDTSKVQSFDGMFYECYNLVEADVSGFDTSNCTSFGNMFRHCYSLPVIDVSGFDTSSAKDMYCMFFNCRAVEQLDVAHFKVGSASIWGMFEGCHNVKELDVSSWDVTGNTSFRETFTDCKSITRLDLSSWDTTSAEGEWSFYDTLGGLDSLEKLVLGEKFRFSYDTAGLSGNWRRVGDPTEYVWTGVELMQEYVGATMYGTYVKVNEAPTKIVDPTYEARGLGDSNLWEIHTPQDKFKGYCINGKRVSPAGYYDKVLATDENIFGDGLVDPDNYGWEPLGSNMREALITLIYYNAPQTVIWDFTTYYSNRSEKSKEWAQQHRYEDIPDKEKYSLYLYVSRSGYQNLMAIEGLLDQPYGGVEIHKYDKDGKGVKGAEFEVLDSSGEVVATFSSGVSGLAGLFRMDNVEGLPLGTYTIRESKAAPGFIATSDYYEFSVTEDQQMVSVGRLNGAGDDVAMEFVNEKDESYQGGGIAVLKVGEDGAGLASAEFSVYDAAGNVAATIVTDDEGRGATGIRELPLGTYTVRETAAPVGYHLCSTEYEVELTEDGLIYIDVLEFEDAGKTGGIVVEAQKVLENVKLKEGQFTFGLYAVDEQGKALAEPLFTATNDADGKVAFPRIEYGVEDLGYVNYVVKEIPGDDETVTYDTHEEAITVLVEDVGEEALRCSVLSDDDGVLFTNVGTPPEPTSPTEVVLVKHLQGALVHSNEFRFSLYDSEGNLRGTATSGVGSLTGEDGYSSSVTISFDPLVFDEEGTYDFVIREHMEGATEVVEGDEWNQQGFEPGFYYGGVKYDDREYPVSIGIQERDGKLYATVAYQNNAESAALYNEYNEEYTVIDGNDSHPDDGLHTVTPQDGGKESAQQGKTPAPSKPAVAGRKTASPRQTAGTADAAPLACLGILLALSTGGAGLSLHQRIRSRRGRLKKEEA